MSDDYENFPDVHGIGLERKAQPNPAIADAFRRGAEAMREVAAKVASAEVAKHNTGSGFDSNSAYVAACRIETAIRALPLPETP